MWKDKEEAIKLIKENIIMDLNEREIEVVKLIAEGRSNVFIADKLCRSECAIRCRLKKIYMKLGINGNQLNKRVNLALWGHGIEV